MKPDLLQAALATKGFMPEDEGMALYQAAAQVKIEGAFLEIGSYCGKSTIYLGAAAQATERLLFAVDHHRGSEENQIGWPHHDPDLVDPQTNKLDTLPTFRRTIANAGLEATVVAIVGDSIAVGSVWNTPLALLFIDGGHGQLPAHQDFQTWVPHLAVGGALLIHDVFPNPAAGGRPPYEIYCRALQSRNFQETSHMGSLRVLHRTH